MDNDAQQEREFARQTTIHEAVEAIDRTIMNISDGTTERTNRLTLAVAMTILEWFGRGFNDAMRKLLGPAAFSDDRYLLVSDRGRIAEALTKARDAIKNFPEKAWSVEKFLIFELAAKFVQKVGYAVNSDLLRYEMKNPAVATPTSPPSS